MEQLLLSALIFALSSIARVTAWVSISASRRVETIDAKITQQAILKRMAAKAIVRSRRAASEQHQAA